MSSQRTWIAALGVVVTVLALTALLLAVPLGYNGFLGFAGDGSTLFRQKFSIDGWFPRLSVPAFVWAFRACVLVSWSMWLWVLAEAIQGRNLPRAAALRIIAVTAFMLALLSPPVLSGDVLGYAAYGRLDAIYGLNPYSSGSRHVLEQLGEPTAEFFRWSSQLPYGPGWTLLAAAIAEVGSLVGGLYLEVAAHKALAAAALLGIAFGGARIADHHRPGQGAVTFLALGLNPLLLMEGPGTGHNDLLMLSGAVWACVWSIQRRWWLAAAGLAAAIAIKPVMLVAVPAFAGEYWRSSQSSERRKTPLLIALIAAPFLALSLRYGGPEIVGLASTGQVQFGGAGLVGLLVGLTSGFLIGFRIVWRQSAAGRWFIAWMPVAAALMIFGTTLRLPWYLSWLLVPALTGWTEAYRITLAALVTLSVLAYFLYTAAVT